MSFDPAILRPVPGFGLCKYDNKIRYDYIEGRRARPAALAFRRQTGGVAG